MTIPPNPPPPARCVLSAPLPQLPTTDAETGRYVGIIAPAWTIGPKVHGGTMVAASAAAATRWLTESDASLAQMAPIAASSDFLGAPEPGEVEYAVHIRKKGRQICLADAELIQNGRTLVRTAFTFGHLDADGTRWSDTATDMPAEPDATALEYTPDSPMGKIVHVGEVARVYLDAKWADFARGETGAPRARLWIRPLDGDEADPRVRAAFAMMAADMSPPVPINLGQFGWSPTVQMTTYLRRIPAPGWLRVIATAREVGERMFDEDQLVIDSTGAVVAQSRQLALIPAAR
ncbi:thioesterase family protein [Nocardia sp. NPDC050718]|uniref:thioesterase family protein n=1 Tax=Nocardia sp. NPDC050718 TaxID=3155788 RepID=UPI0033C75D17